jgi:hypothetical protein
MPPNFRLFLFRALAPALLCALVLPLANPASPTIIDRTGGRILPTGPASNGGPLETSWQAVPTTLTDVATRTSHVTGYCLFNSTAGSITMTVQTKDSVPLPMPLSGALAAGTSACFVFEQGLRVNGGFSIQAGATGVYYGTVFTN